MSERQTSHQKPIVLMTGGAGNIGSSLARALKNDYHIISLDLAEAALAMARFWRRPEPGVIFHSDRGSQYASHAIQARLAGYGMTASMSRRGNCWDNAPTESFFNSLKNERVHGTRYRTREEATADLFQYIAVFYNRSRRHSTLNYCSPTQFLQDWISQQNQQTKAA